MIRKNRLWFRLKIDVSNVSVLAVFLLIVLSFIVGSATAQSDGSASSDQRPNILFIMIDDLSEEALGAYKPDTYETPRMDELAERGLTFRHAYSMDQCYHSRATLMSGTYISRFSPVEWGQFPESFPKQYTLGRVLQSAGYRTAIAGKWQLELLQSNPNHPHELGFDEYMLYGWHEGPRYWSPLIWTNGKRKNHLGKYGPDLYTDFLIDFMNEQKDADQPFFAFYSMALVHSVGDNWTYDSWLSPFAPSPHGPKGRWETFEEMLTEADEKIGQLVWSLEQMGIRDETIVILASDNGSYKKFRFEYRNGSAIQKTIEHPGDKGSLTEGGIHVPLIVSWPGKVPEGKTTDALVDFSDLLPTFADLAGAKLPDAQYDGKSFAPVLQNPERSPREWICAEGFPPGDSRIVRNRRWKLYHDGKLYDMKNDPEERNPIDPSSLPPEEQQEVEKLREAMDRIKRRVGQGW